jgi:hypothetical protein
MTRRRTSKRDLTGLPLLMWLPERRGHNREGERFHKVDAIDGSGAIQYTIDFPLGDEAFFELYFQYRYASDSMIFVGLEEAKAFAERDFREKMKPKRRQTAER